MLNNPVNAIVPAGEELFIGGDFTNAGNDPYADHLAHLVGADWYAVNDQALNSGVNTLAVVGPELYIGGIFTDAGEFYECDFVARLGPTEHIYLPIVQK